MPVTAALHPSFRDATRAGYLGIFAKALPDEGLKQINNVADDSNLESIVDKVFNTMTTDMMEDYERMLDFSGAGHTDNSDKLMDFMLEFTVYSAAGCTNNFMLTERMEPTGEQIVAAQKMADVILRSYSPMAFANGTIDSKYADNCMLDSYARLEEYYRNYVSKRAPSERVDNFIKKVGDARELAKNPELAKASIKAKVEARAQAAAEAKAKAEAEAKARAEARAKAEAEAKRIREEAAAKAKAEAEAKAKEAAKAGANKTQPQRRTQNRSLFILPTKKTTKNPIKNAVQNIAKNIVKKKEEKKADKVTATTKVAAKATALNAATKPEKEKIAVDVSKVEGLKVNAPKANAPKVNAPAQAKEKIVIEELSEKRAVKEVSSKVTENSAPVSSNVKK